MTEQARRFDEKNHATGMLESLLPAAREVLKEIRQTDDQRYAYALLYELRRMIGQIVALTGEGVPDATRRVKAQTTMMQQMLPDDLKNFRW